LVFSIQIALAHCFIEPITQSNFSECYIKVSIGPVLKTDTRIIEHRKFEIVRFLTFVSLVKTVHCVKLTAKAFDDIHPHFSVD